MNIINFSIKIKIGKSNIQKGSYLEWEATVPTCPQKCFFQSRVGEQAAGYNRQAGKDRQGVQGLPNSLGILV